MKGGTLKMPITEQSMNYARFALKLDARAQTGIALTMLASTVGEVISAFPTAKLTREGAEFFVECANGFVAGHGPTAAEAWQDARGWCGATV